MNQNLRNIFDVIQQNEKLSEEERNYLLKSLQDADKELMITAFKLERTEKVKKTTAILLEETIEELEQKRKAVEAQNRELEIEASLERVRAVAMGMAKPEDLLSVCEKLFKELQTLGFSKLRNAIIHILNDEKGFFMDYDYSDFTGGTITNTFYNSHPILNNFLKQIKSASDAFAEVVIDGNQLHDWKEFRRKSGQPEDSRLDNIPALYYYFYSIGIGDVGISTFNPIDENQLEILKRFRNVFELAYRRFMDIQQAVAQAREAKIEASLEKVRARSLAMQRPDELVEVAKLLRSEMGQLGVEELETSSIYIIGQKDTAECWYAIKDVRGKNTKLVSDEMTLQLDDTWVGKEMLKFYRSKKEQTSIVMKGQNRKDWINYCANRSKVLKGYYGNEIPERTYHLVKFPGGYLGAASPSEISKESWDLLKRAAVVFSLAYTRFKDLQDAEARTMEAQIELALERVRARSLAMHNTSELQDVVNILAQQLHKMNLDINGGVFIAINDEVDQNIPLWASGGAADYVQKVTVPFLNKPVFNSLRDAIKKKNNFFTEEHSREEKIALFEHLFKYPPWNSHSQQRKQELLSREGGYTRSVVISNHTSISITNHNGKKFSDDDNEILKRFGNVFEQSYVRFLDLQKAEAQAREAQIETALEKVRSRSLAMHTTNELGDVVTVIVEKLKDLGVVLDANGVVLCTYFRESKDVLHWIVSLDFSFAGSYLLPYFDHPIFNDAWESKESGADYFSKSYSVEEKNSFFKYAFEHSDYKQFPDDFKQWIFQNDKHILSFAWQKNSAILIPSHTGVLPSVDDVAILKRFAKVFEQSYVRFLDLQKAEKQAREAQVELSLERIRAQVTAMKESAELLDIVVTMRTEFVSLGHEAHYFWYMRWLPDKYEKAMTSGDGTRIGMVMTLPRHIHGDVKLVADWEKGDEPTLVFAMDVDTAVEYVEKMITLGDFQQVDPQAPTLDDIRHINGLTFIMARTTHGEIGFSLPGSVPNPPAESVATLARFAGVFDLAYKRFIDLQKVEEHNRIIQADNDRKTKELEDARQLQLSMLPNALPNLPHLDIAVYMKTATEVGGDYYDFNINDNGTLTFIVGDATGHGMMSGMMVSIMKSFFISDRNQIELKQFFENANNSIKDMKLGRLMMALMAVQITPKKLIATNAGMPSLIYFRNKSQKAGEFVSHNFPLGGMKGTIYSLKEIKYEKGDTLLLMSDGLPELRNENDEQFGYQRVKEEFKSVAIKDPEEIINHLKNAATQWNKEAQSDDDITFVVIKIK